MSEMAIEVAGLSKQYRLGQVGRRTFAEDFDEWWSRRWQKAGTRARANGQIWALRDVSFDVERGGVLGIIGPNGAGKSTLLKILSRVTAPTLGEVRIKGRLASLLEVGTGFHPELSGRQNVFLNGAILGMTKAEVARKFDAIVDFAGVDQFIDTPVKRYSSGMHVRLGFAVAAHLEPEILVVDEVLAVGDAAFQQKCLGKMRDVADGGRTVLFVSHNMASINQLCDRAILLNRGSLCAAGPPGDVIRTYFASLGTGALSGDSSGLATASFQSDEQRDMRLREVTLTDDKGCILKSDVPHAGEINVRVDYEITRSNQDAYVTFCLRDFLGVDAWWQYDGDTQVYGRRQPGRYRASFVIPADFLAAGRYEVRPSIVDPTKGVLDYHGSLFHISIADTQSLLARRGVRWPSLVKPPVTWTTTRLDGASG
jgi:lipopolysaccharide transport system ATP-binding protein